MKNRTIRFLNSYQKVRKTWKINPAAKIKESEKIYKRKGRRKENFVES